VDAVTEPGPGPEPDHEQFRIDLGAYLLGALDPAERDRLEAHLGECEACRAELAGFIALPPALGLLDAADLADVADLADLDRVFATAPTPELAAGRTQELAAGPTQGLTSPGGLADRAITSLAVHRRRIRRRVASAVTGLAVAAALITGVTLLNQPAPLRVSATGGTISARAQLTDNAGGSAVVLRLNGVRPHQICALVAEDTAGRRQTAATWVANYEGDAEIHGQSGIATGQLANLIVLGEGDVPLLTLPVKHT
jgi:anti-sigma factor RsiW